MDQPAKRWIQPAVMHSACRPNESAISIPVSLVKTLLVIVLTRDYLDHGITPKNLRSKRMLWSGDMVWPDVDIHVLLAAKNLCRASLQVALSQSTPGPNAKGPDHPIGALRPLHYVRPPDFSMRGGSSPRLRFITEFLERVRWRAGLCFRSQTRRVDSDPRLACRPTRLA